VDSTADTVASWFSDDELAECPSCGAKTYTQPEHAKAVPVCISCGFVRGGPRPDTIARDT
jgi:Zn ribbon nucleic-acid-binding protein